MIALDTNVLIRIIVDDDSKQAKRVWQLLADLENNKQQAFISALVILEVAWVLSFTYKIDRAEIIDHLLFLLQSPILVIENSRNLYELLTQAKSNTYDLSDLMIAYHCKHHQALPVMTFDKKASKFTLFELIK